METGTVRPLAAIAVGLVFALPVRAGIYSPNEPFYFEIDADGTAKPIQFSGGFEGILGNLKEIAMPPTALQQNPRREAVLKRVKDREAKGADSLPVDELAGLTADLIRLNQNGDALSILQRAARDRTRGGFIAYAHLARAFAGTGDWDEAYRYQEEAVRGMDFPTKFAKLTPPQLAWLKKVERDYYLPFLARRAEEARRGRSRDGQVDQVDELFPTARAPRRPENPVRFVGENGQYTPGELATAERKKLPPDALAIVQQLVLWHPQDLRLYWLLAELYNADGEIETAGKIMEACVPAIRRSSPEFMEHRHAIRTAAEATAAARAEQTARVKQQEEAERERLAREERDYRKRFWWIVAIGVALGLMLVYYQVREVIRRVRRRR